MKKPDKLKSISGLLLIFILMSACGVTDNASSRTTDTRSSDLGGEAEQINFLGQYVTLRSAVSETEFHIVYHDNSGGLVPGPTDWDIQSVMWVEDVSAWIGDKEMVDSADFSWVESLVDDSVRPSSQPVYYANSSTTIAVFEPEKLIYFRSTTSP
jgi:hypothetical protein